MTAIAQEALKEYEKAHMRSKAADKEFLEAQRFFDKLSRRMSEKKAWFVSGANFADWRMLRASREERRALKALKVVLEGCLGGHVTAEAILIKGRILFLQTRRAQPAPPANDRIRSVNRLASCPSPRP